MSCLHSWQADEGIIDYCGHSFQCHVACSLDSPFVVLLKQDGTYEALDGGLVGEYSDHVCTEFDLAVEAFQWIGAVWGSLLSRSELDNSGRADSGAGGACFTYINSPQSNGMSEAGNPPVFNGAHL